MQSVRWNIGCSGFYYREWKNVFYPAGLASNKWFAHYAQHFNTIESNVTFYKLPTINTLEKWYAQSPADFNFSVKVPRSVTHYKKMNACEEELAAFYELMKNGLKDKLACILFQFPPSFSFTEERLKSILQNTDKAFDNIVEFRHESWWQQRVYEQLQLNSITFCNIDHPKLPGSFIETSPVFYLRLHGAPDLYRSSYSNEYLDEVVSFISQHKKINKAYIYFNNTMNVAAIDNADHIINRVASIIK